MAMRDTRELWREQAAVPEVMFYHPHPARDTPSHTLMIRRRSATDVAIFTGSALLPLAVRAMELALKLVVAEN